MIITAEWDNECNGWFTKICENYVRLSFSSVERIIPKDSGNTVKLQVTFLSKIVNNATIIEISPIKYIS